ncbi:C40 family peptidase [Paraburkholderia sp. SARCC-3016]|uniref:C40 family peptidase n=1 Tax=Paraburkholderia sp. SARCC-3016 TaxID=3058611 RepID=UPI0028080FAE|nr:C40 family peptidase [Paraburkholderia sp. SARCC-3016]MDQ7980474.1 C40 family peptidase [Paraburkholderia sp. SARCC-3016]
MQHRSLPQACTRVVAGMFIGVLMVAASGTFADEVSSFNQNAAFSTPTSFSGAGSNFLIPSVPSSSSPSNAPAASASSSSSASSDASSSTSGARSFLSGVAGKAGDVVVGALNLIGVRYRWGGSSPDSGLDCSGFVRYVFQDTLGLALPRRAEEMSRVGEKVRVTDLKPGDLVFFNTMRRTFSHVGIYIGDNKFVHSPSTGSTIRVDDMDDAYWEKRFTGARRVETSFSPDQQQDFRQRVSATIGGSN